MGEKAEFREAIASQPDWMGKAAKLAADALAAHPKVPWSPGETVAVVGMGSSTNAGAVFVAALREIGVRAINLDASAVARFPEGYKPADHVIVVSESGRSPEPIAAAARLGVEPIVVTNDPTSPVAAGARLVAPLGGFVDSGVYTIGYTTTLVALASIAEAFGATFVDPATLAGVADMALARYAAGASSLAANLDERRSLDIVGQGPSAGSAQAVALLFREACGMATAPFETLQYLHGPMESCGPHTATMLFGDGRENGIAAQLRDASTLVIQFVAQFGAVPYAAAVEEIIFAQLLAAELAGQRGIKVGEFRFPQPDTKLK